MPAETPPITKGATISPCRKFRYRLWRTWDPELRPACFIGLNPSTADAELDDPTIRRCMGFSRAWGCGGLVMVNLFALRATDPEVMRGYRSFAVGPDNDTHIRTAVIECSPVVAAWGVHGGFLDRDRAVAELIHRSGLPWPQCLGRTKDGHPRHPLYLAKDTPLEPFALRP